VRGAVLGLTRGTTRAHVVRATLESLAFQSRDLVDAMARDAHARVRALQVDGGAGGERLADAVPGRSPGRAGDGGRA
jgi:glycerol kinase